MSGQRLNLEHLEEVLSRDPDNLEQIQQWYETFSEYDIEGTEPVDYILLVFRGLKWVMQFEHTAAEELKEVAERQAVEIAEKEENWEIEQQVLKEEISSLRQQITSTAGTDEMNEAFRAEIDSLNAENSHLKQISRERDRELADQRDKVEELTGKIGIFERERNAWTNTQIQLEDTIRELNRRLSSKTDLAPRNEWESRKLKQRSEQALMLGNQLRNADAQNAELKERVETLTKALEESTALLQETTKKYERLREQFGQATSTAEKLLNTNQDLKKMLDVKDEILGNKEQSAESSTKQLEELLRAKEMQIQRLREANQNHEMEIEELQARLQSEHGQEREEELERLRLELVEATKIARHMFGEVMVSPGGDDNQYNDLSAKLRLRIVQIGRDLEESKQQLEISGEERTLLAKQLEQKDARLSHLYSELDRIRKLTFGDADSYLRDLEKQIEFRDRQLSKLTLKCSLMQLDLENMGVQVEKPKEKPREKLKEKKRRPKEHKQAEKTEKRPAKEAIRQIDEPVKSESSLAETEEQESSSSSSAVQEVIEDAKQPIQPEQKRQFSALELIKLFDDDEISNQNINDLNLLSSLFIELKRLNQQLNEKDKQLGEVNALIKDGQVKLIEQNAKYTKLQTEYDNFRVEIFGSTDVETDADALRSRIEQLQIENMELQRFVDGVRIGGSELERRFEEATRRLIHLGIQLSQYDRKTTNLDRRNKALNDERERLRVQLMRLQSGDERRLKQMARENEMNMIEIARLQNALVHSVSVHSYNKLLANFKRLLHKQTVGQIRGIGDSSIDDHGYESEIEQQQFEISLNDFLRQNRTDEQVLTENSQLKENNEILTKQIEYWKRQHEKQADEIQELNAFLDDLENQTELKSMIANIERRFLQALHEQSDSTEEQLTNEKELKKLRRELHSNKRQWRQDRQKLTEIIMGLQLSVQRLRTNSANSLSVQQLMDLRTATEELKQKEQNVDKQLNEAELKLVELERKEALAEATRESVEQLLASNYQLQDMQLAFQRSIFHTKTLANELKANQKKLDSMSSELKKRNEENADLRKELDELVVGSVDPQKLKSFDLEESFDQRETEPNPMVEPIIHQKLPAFKIGDSDESSTESDRQTPRPTSSISESHQRRTVILNGSEEYEREINAIKKAARISIQNYKEQLERKDRAIDEYRALLNELSASGHAQLSQHETHSIMSDLPMKRSTEILNNAKNEERDKQLIVLRWELAELEEANAQLADQLRLAVESKNNIDDMPLLKQNHTASTQTDYILPSVRSHTDGHQTDDGSLNGEDDRIPKSLSGESSDSGTAVNELEDDEEEELSAQKPAVPLWSSSQARTTESKARLNELQRPTSALSEAQVFQHRNEVRRLRNRISSLELKNRELTTEYDSLKQRTRHLPQRNHDPNAEVNILRKESDRMRRENKNLQQSLKSQSEQIAELEKKLKRKTEHMRDTIESWEEKKALEKELRSVRQKLQVAENKLLELNDKLERRDRLIENLNRAQNERVFSVDKIKNEANSLRKKVEDLQRAEAMLRNENLVLQERIRDANDRIEQVIRDNHSLRSKLPPKSKSTTTAQVQTPYEWIAVEKSKVVEVNFKQSATRPRQNYGMHTKSIQEMVDSATSTDFLPSTANNDARREFKKMKLEYDELVQQYEELNHNYEKLDEEYRLYKQQFRRRESFDSAAVTLLEDKLKGKQRELDRQRQTIEQLEQQLQILRINR